MTHTLETGDLITHKIFGSGLVIETYESQAMVKFDKFGLKKTTIDLLEPKYPKQAILPDPFEEKNQQHRDNEEKRLSNIANNQLD